MRKKSKYKPRPLLQNVMGFVMERVATVTSHADYLTTLRIKNHGALAALTQGKATRFDVDTLIAAFNITEALYRRGFGTDYKLIVQQGQTALRTVAGRGKESGRFILRAEEMTAINQVIELHDAQLDVISVLDMEQAVIDVRREYAAGKMLQISEMKNG
jgi:hypothetical protein